MSRLDEKLAGLGSKSPVRLREEWQRTFGKPAPGSFGPDLLARSIAYRMQEKAFGGLPRKAAQEIARLLEGAGRGPVTPALHPGTRLARDWHGRTHHVVVTETGYRYREHDYRSLTAIAREITGAGWSGPRFFGLTARGGGRG